MPNPTDPLMEDHDHHKTCPIHSGMCSECVTIDMPSRAKKADTEIERARHKRRPTYRHTAKPPWVDFEKQRELVPGEEIHLEPPVPGEELKIDPGITVQANVDNTGMIRLSEKMTTCRITFEDREPERSDSGKAITIHQCDIHLVIITWDES